MQALKGGGTAVPPISEGAFGGSRVGGDGRFKTRVGERAATGQVEQALKQHTGTAKEERRFGEITWKRTAQVQDGLERRAQERESAELGPRCVELEPRSLT